MRELEFSNYKEHLVSSSLKYELAYFSSAIETRILDHLVRVYFLWMFVGKIMEEAKIIASDTLLPSVHMAILMSGTN